MTTSVGDPEVNRRRCVPLAYTGLMWQRVALKLNVRRLE